MVFQLVKTPALRLSGSWLYKSQSMQFLDHSLSAEGSAKKSQCSATILARGKTHGEPVFISEAVEKERDRVERQLTGLNAALRRLLAFMVGASRRGNGERCQQRVGQDSGCAATALG
jgi:hypothetical protein